jgi:hypothetical protein
MLFKESYARGVCSALGQLGLVKFANEEIAAQAADAVSDNLPVEPVEPVAPEATAELAADLIELSNQLEGTAVQAAETAETAAAVSGEKMANRVQALRHKLSGMGSTNDPADPSQKNTQQNAAGVTGEGQMDNAERPPLFANVGVDGVGTQEASGEGAIGSEHERADQDSKAVDVANSATDAIKGASLGALIRKIAMKGSVLDPADASQRNTPAQAASVTGEAERDNMERPPLFANKGEKGVGQSDMAAKIRASSVGTEEAHAAGNPLKQDGSNTAIQQIAKSAEHVEYLKNFEDVANKFASVMPVAASDEEKVSAIQFMMGQGPDERVKIANLIKAAGEIPAALKEYQEKKKKGNGKDDDKKNGDDKKDGDKKDDDKEEMSEDKEAAIRDVLSGLRKLASA